MATTRNGESKKKSPNVDRMPFDNFTGMGYHTKKHFIEVRQKMNDYLMEQQEFQYDQQLHEHQLNRTLLDGKRATKPNSFSSTSTHKISAHTTLNTTQSDRRHKQPSSRHGGAK